MIDITILFWVKYNAKRGGGKGYNNKFFKNLDDYDNDITDRQNVDP